jgi:hypothetical protein
MLGLSFRSALREALVCASGVCASGVYASGPAGTRQCLRRAGVPLQPRTVIWRQRANGAACGKAIFNSDEIQMAPVSYLSDSPLFVAVRLQLAVAVAATMKNMLGDGLAVRASSKTLEVCSWTGSYPLWLLHSCLFF